jgi:hypothetical protein
MGSSNQQLPVSTPRIGNIAEELRQGLNSIQAIAYYVEMALPFSELPSLEYLRKLQELVDGCHEILFRLVRECAATENVTCEATEVDFDHDVCIVSGGGCLR